MFPVPASPPATIGWLDLADRAAALRVDLKALQTAEDTAGDVSSPGRLAADLVTFLTSMEELKATASAAQVVAAAEFTVVHGAELAARNQPKERIVSVIGAQVGLARRVSPQKGSTLVRMAATLRGNLPGTLAALFDGTINEYRAGLVAARAGWLSDELQARLDAVVAPQLAGLGDLRAADLAAGVAYQLDPEGAVARIRKAVADRRVGIRSAPDTMVWLSALLPVADGVAGYAALRRHADACRLAGDPRGRDQIMADELVARLTGTAAGVTATGAPTATVPAHTVPAHTVPAGNHDADNCDADLDTAADTDPTITDIDDIDDDITDDTAAGSGPAAGGLMEELFGAAAAAAAAETSPIAGGLGRSLELLVIITDQALFGGGDEPAHLLGYGQIPARLARDLATTDATTATRIRRLFTDPAGRLIAMESRSRTFTPGMKRFLLARDQRCRTPWCNAPIAHADHTLDHADGGPTTLPNGNGKCGRCNQDKNAGLTNHTTDGGHTITVTTPTGHTYTSTAPPQPGAPPTRPGRYRADIRHLDAIPIYYEAAA